MPLKSNTKLMKVADDFADFDLLKPKDRLGPHFQTQETESMFIITIHLKGYRRRDIKVERNTDESRITVSGESPVQDMMVVGGKVVRKDIQMRRFQRSFKIPERVISDKIRVRFNEDDSRLIIRMPKASKGLMGFKIEELKAKEISSGSTELLHVNTNGELSDQENQEVITKKIHDLTKTVRDEGLEDYEPQLENSLELNETEKGQTSHDKQDKENSKEKHIVTNHSGSKEDDSQEPKSPPRKFKICTTAVFGSAFFMSLIVLIYHFVQLDKPVKQQKKTEEDSSILK